MRYTKTTQSKSIQIEDGVATGIKTQDGEQHNGDVIVLSAGCESAQIQGLPDAICPPVRPVKGQMLALQMEEGITVKKRHPHC